MKLPEDTTNQRRGSSGGGTAETYPASGRTTPRPAKGDGKVGDPFTASTTTFQDDAQHVVKGRSLGSGA